MSSCRASTAPSWCSRSASSETLSAGPYKDDPAVLGDANARAPHVVAAAEGGAPVGLDVLVHARRDLAVIDDQLEVLPDADHAGGHLHVPAPVADLDRAVAVVDHRRRALGQGSGRIAVEVETAAGRVYLEPAVERADQAGAGAGRDPGLGLPVARSRVFGAGP